MMEINPDTTGTTMSQQAVLATDEKKLIDAWEEHLRTEFNAHSADETNRHDGTEQRDLRQPLLAEHVSEMKTLTWKEMFASLNPSPIFEGVAMLAEELAFKDDSGTELFVDGGAAKSDPR
jgi:hypothetical protein